MGDLRQLYKLPPNVVGYWMWSSLSRADKYIRRIRLIGYRHSGGKIYRQSDVDSLLNHETCLSDWLQHRIVIIQTASRFFTAKKLYANWTPQECILERVEAFFKRLGERYMVGVHIRRGDHMVAKSRSPSHIFVEYMRKALQETPDLLFLLATDSADEVKQLDEQFPKRIVPISTDHFKRTDPAAIESAMVELLALSRTNYIIGSFGSSFSETAAEIGEIPLIIATSKG